MALTAQQSIPERPKVESEPWTIRRLFPFANIVSTLSKVFVNPFDILLGYMVVVAGIGELIGREPSGLFWAFSALVLVADVALRAEIFKAYNEE